jgi:hypothetical protein
MRSPGWASFIISIECVAMMDYADRFCTSQNKRRCKSGFVDAAPQDQVWRAVGVHAGNAAAAIGCEDLAARRRHDAFRPRQIAADEGEVGPRDGECHGARP